MLPLLLAGIADIAADSGSALDNLPVDPVRAWGVIVTMFALAVGPVLAAQVQRKRRATSEAAAPSASVVINGSITPHIDASQALLSTLVGNLQAEHDQLAKLHIQLVRDVSRYELKVEQLESRVRELEAENNVLHGRLMDRP